MKKNENVIVLVIYPSSSNDEKGNPFSFSDLVFFTGLSLKISSRNYSKKKYETKQKEAPIFCIHCHVVPVRFQGKGNDSDVAKKGAMLWS